MQSRHLYPIVRLLLPFLAGIITGVSLEANTLLPLSVWISLLLMCLLTAYLLKKRSKIIKDWIFGMTLSVFLFISGYNSVKLHKEILDNTHFAHIQSNGTFIAEVEGHMEEKDFSNKTLLSVTGIKNADKFLHAKGRILAYFAKDSLHSAPAEGSTIVFTGDVRPIGPPSNPGAFDYRKYMAISNVYHQVYVDNSSWMTINKAEGINITRTAHRISQKFVNILNQNGLKGQEFAVASALILGQEDMLDSETLQAYSGTGVMHILSVSGLHVGVIYIVINFLLGFLKKEGTQLYLKITLILITIWAYALLTGMSPPVLRSAAMFTFISIGTASKRFVDIINSLAVSAFALLLYDPLMISNIGFQLSYLAIVGIVFINKPIAGLFEPRSRIGGLIWDLIAVSLAAQIATVPLTLLYFHQFPMYFIPANMIAIPLSFVAIYAGLSVLLFSCVPWLNHFLGMMTNYIFYCLDHSVRFIEKLPYSVIHINNIFTVESTILYSIIVTALLLITFRKKFFIYLILIWLFMLSVCLTNTELQRKDQQRIVFYCVNKQTALGFIQGKHQTLLADSSFLNNPKSMKFNLDGAKALYGIKNRTTRALDTINRFFQDNQCYIIPVKGVGNFVVFGNKHILITDHLPAVKGTMGKLNIDYIVIRNNPSVHIKDLQSLFNPRMLIIDGSNSLNHTDKWIAGCSQSGIQAYSIRKQGALVVEVND